MRFKKPELSAVTNEPSDWLIKLRDSAARADAQTKTGVCLVMFSVAVQLVPNSVAATLLRILRKLQHSQPTMFYHRQLLSALHTELQSTSQSLFWLPSSMDLFASKRHTHLHAFANIFKVSTKARWALSVRLTSVADVFAIDPTAEVLTQ